MKIAVGLLLLSCVLPAAEVRLPPYARHVLPNGAVLDVMPRRNVPLVTIRVLVKGGIESDPGEISGLAAATAEALRRGTAKRTAEQFSRELDELGADFQTGANMQSTFVSLELLSKDLTKGLDLLVDALAGASFPESEVKKLVAQRVDAAKALKDNAGGAATEYFRALFYGPNHPYGRPADELTLGRIDRNVIAEYHKKMYVGRNIVMVVAGDVDGPAAIAAVSKAFASVPEGTAWVWKKAELPKSDKPRLAIVNKPDATETQFRIGMPGINRNSPDRVPLWLVNTLFGGRFTSVLNDALRVSSGLTYGAGSVFDQDHLTGRITISSFTATENTVKAVDMALDQMKQLVAKGVTAEQLASAKEYLKGTYPSDRLETADQLADVIATIELFELNRGEVDDLFSRIDAVTVEKANEIARHYLQPSSLTILLLGNAAKFEAEAKKYASDPIRISIGDPGLRVRSN